MNKFDENKISNVVLQFKIPIAFDVLNSFKEEDNGKPYEIQIDGISARLHFSRIYDFKWKEEYNLTPYSKIEEDRSALLSYSQIQVWFDNKMIESGKIKSKFISVSSDEFIEQSLIYLNKFISIYRRITDQFWIRNIVRKDIFSYSYVLIDENGEQQSMFSPISGGPVKFNGGKEFNLNKHDDKSLRNYLKQDYYGFKNDMIMLMEDNFSLGRHNLALLQGATLFEYFIYSELKQVLSKTKLDKIKRKVDCRCLVGISEICSRGFKEHFDFDFGATNEWKEIQEFMLRPRNKIVHGDILENITKEDCYKGLIAVKKGEILLREKVFNSK